SFWPAEWALGPRRPAPSPRPRLSAPARDLAFASVLAFAFERAFVFPLVKRTAVPAPPLLRCHGKWAEEGSASSARPGSEYQSRTQWPERAAWTPIPTDSLPQRPHEYACAGGRRLPIHPRGRPPHSPSIPFRRPGPGGDLPGGP